MGRRRGDESTLAFRHSRVLTNTMTTTTDDRSWMFCPTTGALLELDADRNVAWCPVSGHEQDLDGERWRGDGRGGRANSRRRVAAASCAALFVPLSPHLTHPRPYHHRAGRRPHCQRDRHGGENVRERKADRQRERRQTCSRAHPPLNPLFLFPSIVTSLRTTAAGTNSNRSSTRPTTRPPSLPPASGPPWTSPA